MQAEYYISLPRVSAGLLGINLRSDCSCTAQATWPDGEKVLNYLKDVDHLGLTGEIRFDSDGFRTDIQLDLIEVR